MKIQQRNNGNSVAGKSEANAQDYSSEARDNYEHSLCSGVANQIFILGYPSATTTTSRSSFLITALKKFGFGKEFIKWIQILLKNQESCIINGGTTTKYFKLQKGTR